MLEVLCFYGFILYRLLLDTFGAICGVVFCPAAIHSYFDNVVRKFKP